MKSNTDIHRGVDTRSDAKRRHCSVDAEFARWMAKYEPVEREIMAERERREERRQLRRYERTRGLSRAFGDFCEATEGRATDWRENGFCSFRMAFEIATDALTRKTAERYFKLLGRETPKLPRFSEIASSLITLHFMLSLNFGAVISFLAIELFAGLANNAVNYLKQRAIRPFYYERERMRRLKLASDRRKIVKRRTLNSCPSKEVILDAYIHRKDSKESAIYFGSLIHDLECYVDNSLRFAEGRITGRNHGIKGWLDENIPALGVKYTTVMRYKAMAKKLKQLVGLYDPVPAEAVLAGEGCNVKRSSGDNQLKSSDINIEKEIEDNKSTEKKSFYEGMSDKNGLIIDEKVVRAVAIYREISEGVKSATGMLERIDAFLDPGRVEEATTLACLRERYKNEITVRNKSRWWRRLIRRLQ